VRDGGQGGAGGGVVGQRLVALYPYRELGERAVTGVDDLAGHREDRGPGAGDHPGGEHLQFQTGQ
jgi:hypothetical protein